MVQNYRDVCRDEALVELSHLSAAALRAPGESAKARVERNTFRMDSRNKPFDGRIPERFRHVPPTKLVVTSDRHWPLGCEPLEGR
jgi:hypothetical protein